MTMLTNGSVNTLYESLAPVSRGSTATGKRKSSFVLAVAG